MYRDVFFNGIDHGRMARNEQRHRIDYWGTSTACFDIVTRLCPWPRIRVDLIFLALRVASKRRCVCEARGCVGSPVTSGVCV